MDIQSPDDKLKNSTGKSAPSLDAESINDGQSATSIRNIPVRNTFSSDHFGESTPKMPDKLPFD